MYNILRYITYTRTYIKGRLLKKRKILWKCSSSENLVCNSKISNELARSMNVVTPRWLCNKVLLNLGYDPAGEAL